MFIVFLLNNGFAQQSEKSKSISTKTKTEIENKTKNGKYKLYFPNGNLKEEGKLKNGKKNRI